MKKPRTFQYNTNNPALLLSRRTVVYPSQDPRLDISGETSAYWHSGSFRSYCLPIFLARSSRMSFNSSIDKDPSITEDRLLTTSYRTVGKSPEVFYMKFTVNFNRWEEDKTTHISFSWFLPVQKTDGIRISHAQGNQLDVGFRKVFLFQAIDSTFSIFLEETNDEE